MLSVAWPGKPLAIASGMRAVIFAVLLLVSTRASASPSDTPASETPATASDDQLTDEEAAQEEAIDALEPPELQRHGAAARRLHRRARRWREHRDPPQRLALGLGLVSSRAASLYFAVTDHLVLRGNVATFSHGGTPVGFELAALLIAHEPIEDESINSGGYLDVGAGWLIFPRRLWSGPTLELGVLRRGASWSSIDDNDKRTTRESVTYAGRVLVGWSWSIGSRWFVSVAVGASRGYTKGGGTTASDPTIRMEPPVPYRLAQWETAFEGFTRVGMTFGPTI